MATVSWISYRAMKLYWSKWPTPAPVLMRAPPSHTWPGAHRLWLSGSANSAAEESWCWPRERSSCSLKAWAYRWCLLCWSLLHDRSSRCDAECQWDRPMKCAEYECLQLWGYSRWFEGLGWRLEAKHSFFTQPLPSIKPFFIDHCK